MGEKTDFSLSPIDYIWSFFRCPAHGMDKDYAETIEDTIVKLAESGIYAEIEEEVDCLTRKFYRTASNKYDFLAHIEIQPTKESRISTEIESEGKRVGGV